MKHSVLYREGNKGSHGVANRQILVCCKNKPSFSFAKGVSLTPVFGTSADSKFKRERRYDIRSAPSTVPRHMFQTKEGVKRRLTSKQHDRAVQVRQKMERGQEGYHAPVHRRSKGVLLIIRTPRAHRELSTAGTTYARCHNEVSCCALCGKSQSHRSGPEMCRPYVSMHSAQYHARGHFSCKVTIRDGGLSYRVRYSRETGNIRPVQRDQRTL